MKHHLFDNSGWGRAFEDEGPSTEGVELDGLRVVFDQKVGLHPANLQKTAGPPAKRAPARMGASMMSRGVRYGFR